MRYVIKYSRMECIVLIKNNGKNEYTTLDNNASVQSL